MRYLNHFTKQVDKQRLAHLKKRSNRGTHVRRVERGLGRVQPGQQQLRYQARGDSSVDEQQLSTTRGNNENTSRYVNRETAPRQQKRENNRETCQAGDCNNSEVTKQ